MNIDQQRMLIAWAELNAKIAAARHPNLLEQVGARQMRITETDGYRALRAWFVRLSPRARSRAVAWMRSQIDGINAAVAQIEASGEEFRYQDLADLVIEFKDDTGREINAAVVDIESSCYGSGSGMPGVVTEAGITYVKCPRCEARWEAHSIGFSIPSHVPQKGQTDAGPTDATNGAV